ncbi:MAG: competence/damage-inducible protein A [Candidatus Neomarinimicrobiota bacterium]
MKIGVLTIGAELLNGSRIDTNASWIANAVIHKGASVAFKMSVPDSESKIIKALNFLLSQSIDMLIVTGGLGPTHDDITAETLYSYFNDETIFDDDYWDLLVKRFKKRGFEVSKLNRSQALKPLRGELINNPIGTARGLLFKKEKKDVFVLPGVPREMQSMMKESVLPLIKKRSKGKIFSCTLRTTGIPESSLYDKLIHTINNNQEAELAFLPSYLGVDIRISSDKEDVYNIFFNEIKNHVHEFIYTDEDVELEHVVVKLLNDKKLSISTAESCTGGLIGDRITNVPGASQALRGGIIAYSNEVKTDQLSVNEKTIEKFGAVSEETAAEMAIGVKKLFSTDVGVSTTGIAGPSGGTKEKPVGLVYCGISINDKTLTFKNNFKSDRKINKMITSQVVLNIIRKELTKI